MQWLIIFSRETRQLLILWSHLLWAQLGLHLITPPHNPIPCPHVTHVGAGAKLDWFQPAVLDTAATKGEGGLINPFAHFGACTTWPRGYPMASILKKGLDYCHGDTLSRLERVVYVPIQHGLINSHPDVDAIWPLSFPDRVGKVNLSLATPPLVCSAKDFAPYSGLNTVYYRWVRCDT
jgi:hypothetical protein